MGDFETVNDLSILTVARRPQWVAQGASTGAPDGTGGVYLQDSPKAALAILVREETHRRSGRVAILFDGASTYTVDIDGNAVATVGNIDLATTIADLAADITADTPAGAGDLVTATAVESVVGGGIDTLLLRGKAEADFVVTLSVAGGAGTITGTLDRSGTSTRLWFTGKSPNAPGATSSGGAGVFALASGAAYVVDYRGFVERFDTAGLDRGYAELHTLTNPADVAGAAATIAYRTPDILWGPAVKE